MKKIIISMLTGLSLLACTADKVEQEAVKASYVSLESTKLSGLSDYWYQGKAEINRYRLQQNRYKDVHPGEAIHVFVTEDFLTDKQVKNDNYRNPNSTPILKNNFIKKFSTGIYDYSIMTSVFTPVKTEDFPNTLKVSTSSQEWCGHTFMQLNQAGKNYKVKTQSYFESEGDTEKMVPLLMTEDEVFNRIRMAPEALPTGKFRMLPGTAIVRLMHLPFEAMQVEASRNDYKGQDVPGEALQSYTIKFPKLDRTLEIVFEKEAPYQIIGWVDSYPSAFDKEIRKTVAVRTHSLVSAYWNQNSLQDMALRKELGY